MAARESNTRTVDVATGIRVVYSERGEPSGPTILLLHAWAESLRSFSRVLDALPAQAHILAMDLRGHGSSDKPLDGYDLASLAADVTAFLDAVAVRSAVIVGASSGGYVAQQVVVQAPQRVEALVLAGAPFNLLGRPAFADEVDALTDPIDPDWARRFVGMFPLRTEIPDEYRADRVRDALRIPAEVWRLSLEGLTVSTPPLRLGRIDTATLAVWGDRDELIGPDDRAAMIAAMPRSRSVTYEGVGHLVLWEQPERLAADVTAFANEVWARPLPPESS